MVQNPPTCLCCNPENSKKTAKRLSIDVQPGLAARTDEVIE